MLFHISRISLKTPPRGALHQNLIPRYSTTYVIHPRYIQTLEDQKVQKNRPISGNWTNFEAWVTWDENLGCYPWLLDNTVRQNFHDKSQMGTHKVQVDHHRHLGDLLRVDLSHAEPKWPRHIMKIHLPCNHLDRLLWAHPIIYDTNQKFNEQLWCQASTVSFP